MQGVLQQLMSANEPKTILFHSFHHVHIMGDPMIIELENETQAFFNR